MTICHFTHFYRWAVSEFVNIWYRPILKGWLRFASTDLIRLQVTTTWRFRHSLSERRTSSRSPSSPTAASVELPSPSSTSPETSTQLPSAKALWKVILCKLITCNQFHQHLTSSFCNDFFWIKSYKPKLCLFSSTFYAQIFCTRSLFGTFSLLTCK